MILIDSSCWVEAYRRGGEPSIQRAVATALEEGPVAVCGMVWVEVLGFVRDGRERRIIETDLGGLRWLDSPRGVFDDAASLGRELRSAGMTVPATDLLIASTAMAAGATLLHADRHFETVAAATTLRQINPRMTDQS